MLCVVRMIQQAQPVACSDTLNTRTHTLSDTHSLHLHLQLTSMQYMVQSVWFSQCLKVVRLHQNHTPSNTQLYKHTHARRRTHTRTVRSVMFENSHFKLSSCLLLYLWYLNCPQYCVPPDPPSPPHSPTRCYCTPSQG